MHLKQYIILSQKQTGPKQLLTYFLLTISSHHKKNVQVNENKKMGQNRNEKRTKKQNSVVTKLFFLRTRDVASLHFLLERTEPESYVTINNACVLVDLFLVCFSGWAFVKQHCASDPGVLKWVIQISVLECFTIFKNG